MSDLFVPARQRQAARASAPAAIWLLGCALVPLLAAGCMMNDGISRVVEVGPRQFTSVVLESKQPILVNFYKPG